MRILVVILTLLAAGKVATVEWLHRATSDDVIVAAYGPRALDACSRDARRRALGLDAAAWAPGSPMHVEIGRQRSAQAPEVYLWQVDNPAWVQRYRHPYLVVTAAAGDVPATCSYDVLAGTAVAARL